MSKHINAPVVGKRPRRLLSLTLALWALAAAPAALAQTEIVSPGPEAATPPRVLFAVANEGYMRVYVDGSDDCRVNWIAEGVPVPAVPADATPRTGADINWANFRTVFAGGDGIVYAVTQEGRLIFFRLLYELTPSGFTVKGWSADSNTEIGCPSLDDSDPLHAKWSVYSNLSGFSRMANERTGVIRAIWAVDQTGTPSFFKHGWRPGGLVEDYCGNWTNEGVGYTRSEVDWVGPTFPSGTYTFAFEGGGGLSFGIRDGFLYRFRLRPDGTWVSATGSQIGTGWHFKFVTGGPGEYSIQGYVSTRSERSDVRSISTLSLTPGATVRVRASTFSPTYTAQVVRLRRNTASDSGNPDTASGVINGVTVGAPATTVSGNYKKEETFNMSADGANWESDGVDIPLPANAVPGIYAVLLTTPSGGRYMAPFVVKPLGASPPAANIAVLANVNTWNAYNEWGGGSRFHSLVDMYLQDSAQQWPAAFSYERPFEETPVFDGQHASNGLLSHDARAYNHLVRSEVWATTWLDALKAVDPKYNYDMLTDVDLDQCSGVCIDHLKSYKALVVTTHPEVWTDRMRDRLDDYLNGGGHLVYLAGAGLFDRATITESGRMEVRHGIGGNCLFVGSNSVPCPPRDLFRDRNRSERAVLGLAYEIGKSFKPNARGSGGAFQVQGSAHSFFTANFPASLTTFGSVKGLNASLTAAGAWVTGQRAFAEGEDKYCLNSLCPASHKTAVGTLIARDNAGSDIVYRRTGTGNGWVFSAPSISFGGVLAIDTTVQRIVRNVLDSAIANTQP